MYISSISFYSGQGYVAPLLHNIKFIGSNYIVRFLFYLLWVFKVYLQPVTIKMIRFLFYLSQSNDSMFLCPANHIRRDCTVLFLYLLLCCKPYIAPGQQNSLNFDFSHFISLGCIEWRVLEGSISCLGSRQDKEGQRTKG